MADEKGIKEITEVLEAAGALSVLVYKVQKGGGTPSEIGQRIAIALMQNPDVITKLKVAADGIGEVPAEAKDLTMIEGLQLIAVAGKIAAECAVAVKG
jgi:hypothetical protein